tara:strand:- start:215 stop:376 length:162 start_codon:yes stop_codon:yes gene_type:complete
MNEEKKTLANAKKRQLKFFSIFTRNSLTQLSLSLSEDEMNARRKHRKSKEEVL